MKALTILTGAAGLAAVVGMASPAAAQYYPGNPYGYGNSGTGVVGAIIGALGGYGQYPYGNYGYGYADNRVAVDQCARAVEARINGGYGNYGGGYGNYGYGNYGYNNGYAYGGGRVQGITSVERKNSGIRVKGVATSGRAQPYGGYGQQAYPDLRFNCKVDFRGRITDLDLDRTNVRYNNYGYRGY